MDTLLVRAAPEEGAAVIARLTHSPGLDFVLEAGDPVHSGGAIDFATYAPSPEGFGLVALPASASSRRCATA